jgi:hypothetical protein
MIGSFKDDVMRIGLGLGSAKEFDTAGANLSNVPGYISVCFEEFCEFSRQFAEGEPLTTNASADVTGRVRPGRNLIGFG